jgi:hypothetical protein
VLRRALRPPKQVTSDDKEDLDARRSSGLWFHGFEHDTLRWQGQIVGRVDHHTETKYLVRLFDWSSGAPDLLKLIAADVVATWQFYTSNAAMQNWHDLYRYHQQLAALDALDNAPGTERPS